MTNMTTIGITMGCPAGIGPEIILRHYNTITPNENTQTVIIGDAGVLQKCGRELGLPADCKTWLPGEPIPKNGIPIYNVSTLALQEHQWGIPNTASALAMAEYIFEAVRLLKDGVIDGMATSPISKSALHKAGYNYPGHTEMLVDLTDSSNYTMMMAGKTLRVTLATIHCSLASVSALLTIPSIFNLISITHNALKIDFGIKNPRIAVAGLNPHSSEDGLFGDEEENVIIPAIDQARSQGFNIKGPYPPDTVFFKAAAGQFDAVVCMYHDQGLIPFKLLHFEDGVNVTLGLPIVRTSVDHGTAYDIAGKGVADSSSLAAAVQLAATISNNRKTFTQNIPVQ